MSDTELERLRKRAAKRIFAVFFLCGCLFLASLAVLIREGRNLDENKIISLFLLPVFISGFLTLSAYLGLYFLLLRRPWETFNRAFKERYVPELIAGAGPFQELEYHPESGFSYEELHDAALLDCGDKHHFFSEDMLTGRCRDIRFQYCDVVTRKLTKAGASAKAEILFQGQVIRFALGGGEEAGGGRLQIVEKRSLAGFLSRTAPYKIETGHTDFNQRFQVYAEDERGAFSVLTRDRIWKIMAFSEAVGAWIAILFLGNAMYVAVHRVESLFDPFVDKPVSEQKGKILEDIRILQSAADIIRP